MLLAKYFIDLQRNGHVVRVEHYTAKNALASWLDVSLASFKVGDAVVWMPVSGQSVGLMAGQTRVQF